MRPRAVKPAPISRRRRSARTGFPKPARHVRWSLTTALGRGSSLPDKDSPVTSRPPAILLGGLHNALSLTRSLGRQGAEITLLADSSTAPAKSRLCSRVFRPDGPVQPGWLEWLLSRPSRGAVLLPCSDNGLELVARNRQELVDHGYRPFEADDQVLLTMLDKQATYERARTIGIDCPQTLALTDETIERVGD